MIGRAFAVPHHEIRGAAGEAVEHRGLFAELAHEVALRVGADAFPEVGAHVRSVVDAA
ncbi:hypothetical protein OKW46_003784 [Paraburkholderia sp. WSM4179]|nr:hypothetical protein [Paraburkholderia sp. WSM4179]